MSPLRRSQVIVPDRLQSLMVRSDVAGLKALAQHVLLLAGLALGSVVLPSVLAIICWLGYAVALVFVFCPLHESIHETAFASRWMNRVVAFVFGAILFLPPRYFQVFHMAHHRYTQIPGRDPELGLPKPRTQWEYIWVVSGLPYWIAQMRMLLRSATGQIEPFVPASRRKRLINESRLFLLLYSALVTFSVAVGTATLWWYWLLPVLVAQPALRLFLMAEHTGCPEAPDMFANTRTTLTHPLFQRLCWNMNFHTAHHAYAGIAFHRLPEANRLLTDHLVHVGHGYGQVSREIFRALAHGRATSEKHAVQ